MQAAKDATPEPSMGPIEALLTAYRRMLPAGCAGSERLSIALSPTWVPGSKRQDHEDARVVSLQVRVGDVVACTSDGDTTEDAARHALERLREGGAPV